MAPGTNGVVVAPSIPAIVIVHKTVSVVVNAISGNFGVVGPVIVNQIDMVVVGATSFKHGDHNAVARSSSPTCGDVPRQIRIDVVVSALNVMPLLSEARIVRHSFAFLHDMVELCCLHTLVGTQQTQHLLVIEAFL